MNTHRPANITRVKNIVAEEKRKGIDLTFDQGVLTVRDPAGHESFADIHSAPHSSGPEHVDRLLATAFQDYVMNVLASGAITSEQGQSYWRRAYTWRNGAYECTASLSHTENWLGHIEIGVTGDPIKLKDSYLPNFDGSRISASFVIWPSPANIQQLLQIAIAQFELSKRFQAYLNKLGVTFDLERSNVILHPVTVSFENTISIGFDSYRGTPLLEKSRLQIELIETFIEEDAKRMLALKLLTPPASDTELESTLDLV